MSEDDDIEIVEATDVQITEEGDVIAEDVTAAVDPVTGAALIDDIVAVETVDGDGFVEETITAIDADGNATVIADEIEGFEAE